MLGWGRQGLWEVVSLSVCNCCSWFALLCCVLDAGYSHHSDSLTLREDAYGLTVLKIWSRGVYFSTRKAVNLKPETPLPKYPSASPWLLAAPSACVPLRPRLSRLRYTLSQSEVVKIFNLGWYACNILCNSHFMSVSSVIKRTLALWWQICALLLIQPDLQRLTHNVGSAVWLFERVLWE